MEVYGHYRRIQSCGYGLCEYALIVQDASTSLITYLSVLGASLLLATINMYARHQILCKGTLQNHILDTKWEIQKTCLAGKLPVLPIVINYSTAFISDRALNES